MVDQGRGSFSPELGKKPVGKTITIWKIMENNHRFSACSSTLFLGLVLGFCSWTLFLDFVLLVVAAVVVLRYARVQLGLFCLSLSLLYIYIEREIASCRFLTSSHSHRSSINIYR